MKFSRLERQVLRFIRNRYPIPYDSSKEEDIIAIGERPLPTEDMILQECKEERADSVKKAMQMLLSYQCIVPV
jgi:hypothetical protein